MILRPSDHGIHWQAPTVIILAFTAGLAFAVGHHVFYASLDGKPLDDNIFGQQTNIAIGTGFAFLVRACLVIATCAAYWQVFWETALRKTLTISSVDALTGVLGSLVEFSSIRTLFFNPVLASMALLAWLVPFASLLPPATLSVLPATTTNSTYEYIPAPYFDNNIMGISVNNYLAGDKFSGLKSSTVSEYMNPARQLSRLVATTAYRGTVPEHQTLHSNMTYDLEFVGPAVQCDAVSQDILQPFNRAAGCDYSGVYNSTDRNYEPCLYEISYISWVPNATALVPFDNGTIDGLLPLNYDPSTYSGGLSTRYNSDFLGQSQGSPPTVFVATRSQVYPLDKAKNWDVLNCSLYNATYVVSEHSDLNSRGLPHLSEVRLLNSVAFKPRTAPYPMETQMPTINATIFSYLALMETLNRVLVGSIKSSSGRGDNIYWDGDALLVQNQNTMSTLLSYSTELVPMLARTRNRHNPEEPDQSLWTDVDTTDDGESLIALPDEALSAPLFNQSLATGIEQLFQNMTLSLFSEPRFLRDSEEAVNVTRSYTRNTYSYSQRNLLLSYGVALGLTLLASIAGCVAIIFNGASYTHKFSTILRTTTGLEGLVAEEDRRGADPLPKYLSRANVQLGRSVKGTQEKQHAPEITSERSAMMELGRDGAKSPAMVHERSISQRR